MDQVSQQMNEKREIQLHLSVQRKQMNEKQKDEKGMRHWSGNKISNFVKLKTHTFLTHIYVFKC